jgi:hypothetical protein
VGHRRAIKRGARPLGQGRDGQRQREGPPEGEDVGGVHGAGGRGRRMDARRRRKGATEGGATARVKGCRREAWPWRATMGDAVATGGSSGGRESRERWARGKIRTKRFYHLPMALVGNYTTTR